MTEEEIWGNIRHIFDTYTPYLKYDAIEATAHYLAVGENEMGFEYLILFLYECNAFLNEGDPIVVVEVGKQLKMFQNEWTDGLFWTKLLELCSRHSLCTPTIT